MLNIDLTAAPLYEIPRPVKRRVSGKRAPRIIMKDIEHISTFAHNSAAIDRNGDLWTWGWDTLVEQDGKISFSFPPPSINAPCKRMEHAVAVSSGGESTFCVTADGLLWGWGQNRSGNLGLGDRTPRLEPTIILDGVKSVFASMDTTLCVREDDSLWGWGWSYEGFPIPSAQETALKPVHIMDDVLRASCNNDTALVIKKDGSLWGWGSYITDRSITEPTPLMEDMHWITMPRTDYPGHSLAVSRSGDLYSFGVSNYGSLKPWQKHFDDSLPVKVLSGVNKVWSNNLVTLILLKDGGLLASGLKDEMCGISFGRSGSDGFHKPAFVMPDIKEAAVGQYHSLALKENGDLWLFGRYGLGDEEVITES